jgi:hypothetical protein
MSHERCQVSEPRTYVEYTVHRSTYCLCPLGQLGCHKFTLSDVEDTTATTTLMHLTLSDFGEHINTHSVLLSRQEISQD